MDTGILTLHPDAETNVSSGLTEKEAAERLKSYGFNELPAEKRETFLVLLWSIVREPMFLLLLATALLYVALGDVQDSFSLLGAVLLIIGITLYQKRKTERALQALKDLSSPHAVVLRDGTMRSIPGKEIVPGDIIQVKEGDRVPADALLLSERNLSVEESILTGESVPVTKRIWNRGDMISDIIPGGDNLPAIFSGTLVVRGTTQARVFATGAGTQLGKIGKSLESIKHEDTLLSKEIRRIVKLFSFLGVATCFILVLVYGIYYSAWLKGILAGLTLSISLIPEEFPVVLTVFLTLGAWRISRLKVLTRRPDVIETLGAATVLCVDKTGTITQNKMQLQRLYADGKATDLDAKELPAHFRDLVRYAILASSPNPFDPMEKAIHSVGGSLISPSDAWRLEREYPLTPNLMSMTQVWATVTDDAYIVAAKGSPEAIFSLCKMTADDILLLEKEVHKMAESGLRVLGVANATRGKEDLPYDQHGFDFRFCGLLGFADPVREAVPASLQECYSAGIRVIMITGDYPATAKHIAEKIGLIHWDKVITGMQIDKLTDIELAEKVRYANVFSRVIPHQKLRIVEALKFNGEIVAMTGDGVNDAPALKAAHIGIAMGLKGTDVAREASDIVLLNDDFNSIVAATRMGRRIFTNLQKAISYIIAIHVPIAGLALLPVFAAGLPVILFPVHVAFFELLTDPILSIAFEAEKEEKDVMRKSPRSLDDPMLSRSRLFLSLIQGLLVFITLAGIYFYLVKTGHTADDVRTITFATMIVANIGLVLTNRSWTRGVFSTGNLRNRTLMYLLSAGAIIIGLVFYVPGIRDIFHFTRLHADDLLMSSIAGLLSVAWFEIYKAVKGRLSSI